ncbi:helix-turn-helix domain-containing protein [Tritonibacter mobilis]|uniref:helix-turn-helix domain-containing protein n=1 Tax=Tritonibacter mobilis TaxID=379347 RepID=UPI000E0DA586|nr:helix-turn-helix transcriptional regulator [Tritonibacter mobilis]
MGDFGAQLKDWRQLRRMSQLDLALTAEVSARHVSFLETGRAKPSREMVLRLSRELQLPQAEVNALLAAAGFAPVYGARDLGDAQMAPVRAAVEWMLERHAPYPAIALDRHWRLQQVNAPAQRLMSPVGLDVGDSLLDAMLSNDRLRENIVNLEEVERLILHRLRSELVHFGRDSVIEDHVARLKSRVSTDAVQPLPAMIPTRYRIAGQVLSFFSAMSQFGTVEDIALSELRIECMFPADEATRVALIQLGAS